MARLTLPETVGMRVQDMIQAGYNDGVIQAVAADCSTCAVRHHGSGNLISGVTFAEQISDNQRTAGKRCKLGVFGAKVVVLQTLGEVPTQGTVFAPPNIIPTTPENFAIISHRDGWYCSWDAVDGAAYYEIFSDNNAEGTSPVERMTIQATHVIVPYSLTTDTYFAVRATSFAGHSSDLTAFLTDDTAPDTPSGFSTWPQVGSVLLQVDFGTDTAHTAVDFKEFIAYRADDSGGTGSTEIGRFSDSTWLYEMEMGTEKYFAISAIDWAGNESAKCSWTVGWSLRENAMQEDFSAYGGEEVAQNASAALYWLKIADFESDENWVGSWPIWSNGDPPGAAHSPDTTNYVEGDQGIQVNPQSGAEKYTYQIKLTKAMDLAQEGRFTDSDFCYIAIYVPDASDIYRLHIHFFAPDSSNYFRITYPTEISLSDGWNFVKWKRSDMTTLGAPDWADVQSISIRVWAQVDYPEVTFDDLRIVKADPDDGTVGNDTGPHWGFSGDFNDIGPQWHIYGPNEAGVNMPYSLGQCKASQDTEYLATYEDREFNTAGGGFTYAGMVRIFRDNAHVGLIWCVQDATEDAEDLYAVYLDPANDEVSLWKAVGGSYTLLTAKVAFTCAVDTWYWVGVRHVGNDIKVYASDTPYVFSAEKLKISLTDATYTQGKVGVMCKGLARFTNLVAGSPQFAMTAHMALNVVEGAGYGRGDYVVASPSHRGLRVNVSNAAPSNANNGDIWIETDTDKIKVRESGAWVEYPQAISALSVTGNQSVGGNLGVTGNLTMTGYIQLGGAGLKPLYDSGWVLSAAATHTFTHNLGKIPLLYTLMGADNSGGGSPTQMLTGHLYKDEVDYGCAERSLTTTTFVVRLQAGGYAYSSVAGKWYQAGTDYIRLLIWAAE